MFHIPELMPLLWYDVQNGARVAMMVVTSAVMIAFVPVVVRVIIGLHDGSHISYGDRLGAGIWLSAIGALINSVLVLQDHFLSPWPESPFALLNIEGSAGIALVTTGYFLHVTSWRAAFYGPSAWFPLRCGTALIVALILGTFGSVWLRSAAVISTAPMAHSGALLLPSGNAHHIVSVPSRAHAALN